MKKILTILVGIFAIPNLGLAINHDACKSDLSNKFGVSLDDAAKVCILNPGFMQTCIEGQSLIYSSNDFTMLTEVCIDLLEQTKKREIPLPQLPQENPSMNRF